MKIIAILKNGFLFAFAMSRLLRENSSEEKKGSHLFVLSWNAEMGHIFFRERYSRRCITPHKSCRPRLSYILYILYPVPIVVFIIANKFDAIEIYWEVLISLVGV